MRRYYYALLIISLLIAISIAWLYQLVVRSLGSDLALVVLTFTVITVVAFVIRGVVYASRLEGYLRGQAKALRQSPQAGAAAQPVELKLFGLTLFRYPEPYELKEEAQVGLSESEPLESEVPRRPLGKQPRFPEEKIRRAVLKWERRDRNFSARTLEEFLDQEFGTGPDGILLMAPTTFYGWRKRILGEIQAKARS
jgi:hypothetical protein